MFRRLAVAAALCFAPFLSVRAQMSSGEIVQHDSAQCATLHDMMLQHLSAMGIDSTHVATLHAALQDAIARGASPDSLHHAILHMLMQDTSAHMQLDSTHIAAIHACLDSHASTNLEKRR
jgi:hypothetical protein